MIKDASQDMRIRETGVNGAKTCQKGSEAIIPLNEF